MNTPATFQVIVNSILREYLNKFTVAYLNNVFIYLETLEKYKKYIKNFLETLQSA